MRMVKVCLVAIVSLVAGAGLVEAQTIHEITVILDDATAADQDLLSAAASAAPAGDAGQAVRKLASGVLLEVRLLVDQRVADGVLTLDDGSLVTLTDGDRIRARTMKKCSTSPCLTVVNGAVLIPSPGSGGGTPTYVEIYKAGLCTRMLTFPFEGHKPTLSACGS
jgi:hypothetical protein